MRHRVVHLLRVTLVIPLPYTKEEAPMDIRVQPLDMNLFALNQARLVIHLMASTRPGPPTRLRVCVDP